MIYLCFRNKPYLILFPNNRELILSRFKKGIFVTVKICPAREKIYLSQWELLHSGSPKNYIFVRGARHNPLVQNRDAVYITCVTLQNMQAVKC